MSLSVDLLKGYRPAIVAGQEVIQKISSKYLFVKMDQAEIDLLQAVRTARTA